MDRRPQGRVQLPMEYLAQKSPITWWLLGCVPFSNASGFTLVRFFAQYRARSSDPAARKDTDLSDPFAHHPAQDRELHLRVLGVQAHRGGGRLVRALGT